MDDFYYRKLNVYHLSVRLVKEVYQLTNNFPLQEKNGLTNQIQRAAISIPTSHPPNISLTSHL